MPKSIRTEEVKVTIEGKEYVGTCTIEGQRTMFQTVHYGDLSDSDPITYVHGHNSHDMYHHARELLVGLVFKAGLRK